MDTAEGMKLVLSLYVTIYSILTPIPLRTSGAVDFDSTSPMLLIDCPETARQMPHQYYSCFHLQASASTRFFADIRVDKFPYLIITSSPGRRRGSLSMGSGDLLCQDSSRSGVFSCKTPILSQCRSVLIDCILRRVRNRAWPSQM